MRIFITGATGYIGGSLAHRLLAEGHQVTGLVRSEARAEQARARGIAPLLGTLDDGEVLAREARAGGTRLGSPGAVPSGRARTRLLRGSRFRLGQVPLASIRPASPPGGWRRSGTKMVATDDRPRQARRNQASKTAATRFTRRERSEDEA